MDGISASSYITASPLCSSRSRLNDSTAPLRTYNSTAETPKNNILYEGKYFSPWLSKPRKSEKSVVDRISISSTATNLFNGSPNPNQSLRKKSTLITKENHHQRFDYDTGFTLETLKQALQCLGVEPDSDHWQVICKILKADEFTKVKFSDFMKEVKKKDSLRMELDFNGVTREQLFCTAFGLSDRSLHSSNSVLLSVLSEKIIKLREENKVLVKEVEHLKAAVEEKTNMNDELEQKISRLHMEKRVDLQTKQKCSENAENSKGNVNNIKGYSTMGTQTDTSTFNVQKRLSALSKRLHRSEFNYHLYKIATEKLLQFTKIVHDVLSDSKTLKPSQNEMNGESSNFIVHKDGERGKVLRASSVCTVDYAPNKRNKHFEERDTINLDYLHKLAAKAKYILISIQDVLQDDKEMATKYLKTNPDPPIVQNRGQLTNTATNEIRSTVAGSDGKKVIWV